MYEFDNKSDHLSTKLFKNVASVEEQVRSSSRLAMIVLAEAIVSKSEPFDSTYLLEQNTAHVYDCEVKDNLQNEVRVHKVISSSRSKFSHIRGSNETVQI